MPSTVKEAYDLIEKTLGEGSQRVSGRVALRYGSPVAEQLAYATSKGRFNVLLEGEKVILLDENGRLVNSYGYPTLDDNIITPKTRAFFEDSRSNQLTWSMVKHDGADQAMFSFLILLAGCALSLLLGIIAAIAGYAIGGEYLSNAIAFFVIIGGCAFSLVGLVPAYIIHPKIFVRLMKKALHADFGRAGYHIVGDFRLKARSYEKMFQSVQFDVFRPGEHSSTQSVIITSGGKMNFDRHGTYYGTSNTEIL